MTNLERRALLGDKQAQEECTRLGIVLGCPLCGKKEVLTLHSNGKIYHNYTIECAFNGRFVKLKDWNTRPAPPIGRCKDCKNWRGGSGDEWSACKVTNGRMGADEYCNNFEPRNSDAN